MRVGVLLPFTGPEAHFGLGMRNAIRMAADEVNARGGIQGRRLKLVELDEGTQPELAAAAARTLVADPRVIAAIGSSEHDAYTAARTVLGEPRVPFLPAAITERDLTTVGLNLYPAEYSVLPFGTSQMEKAAKYAWDVLGARTFLYTREKSNFGLALINQMRFSLSPYFKTIVTGEEVLGTEADVPELVAKIKAAPPQYIFFSGRPALAAAFLSGLREAGVKSAFQAAMREPSQEFIDLAKDKAEGALMVFPGLPAEDFPAGREFLKAYAAKGYPEPPGAFGVIAYAEAQTLFAALERSFLTRPSVAGALKNGQFDTALGPVRFNFVGSSYQTMVIHQVVKGRWTPIYLGDKKGITPFVAR